MSFDLNKIVNLASLIMPDKVDRLKDSIEKANNVLQNSQGKDYLQILRDTGVSKDFLETIRKNTSNSIAGKFLNVLGLDVNKANNILDTFINSTCDTNTSNPISSQNTTKKDDIDILKQGLLKVKKK